MANPIADDDLDYTVDEDSILRVTPPNSVLVGDADGDGDSLAAFMNSFPENPLFKFKTNGTFTYDARYHGVLKVDGSGNLDSGGATTLTNGFDSLAEGGQVFDNYTYLVTDGQGTDEGAVKITITGVNDAPVADDDFAIYDRSVPVISIDALDGDTDVDIYPVADSLTLTGIKDIADGPGSAGGDDADLADGDSIITAEGGTVTFNGTTGQFEYVAAPGFFGIDSFEYTVSDRDDGTGLSDTGIITVNVLPGNSGPTANADTYTADETDGAAVFATVLGNDTDPPNTNELGAILSDPIGSALFASDSSGNPLGGGGPTGTLSDFNADGTFTYSPNGEFTSLAAGASAYVSFKYKAFDANGEMSEATVTIEIKGENDDPTVTAPADQMVYEAGLANGSNDGPIIIQRDFVIMIDDPDSDPTIAFSEGSTPDTGDQTTANGTWSIIDNDSSDGQVVVRYTLTTKANHPATDQGHGSVTIPDSITVYVMDGGATAASSMTLQADIVDDISFLASLPGGSILTLDSVADNTITFDDGATPVMDTFTHIQGADGAGFEMMGIPNDFTLLDGRVVSSSVTVTLDGDPMVIGTDDEGDRFYQIVFDPDAATDTGKYTFTMFQDQPVDTRPVDFSSVRAGGPQETLTVRDIAFDGVFFTPGADINATAVNAAGSSDDINPNNAGGIGIGNGNIERAEALLIDVSASPDDISGVELDLQGVGGGIGVVTILWEAVKADGSIVSGSLANIDLSLRDAQVVRIEPGVDFEKLYVAIDPSTIDGNDKARINNIDTIESIESDDYLLGFQFRSVDGDNDLTQTETFYVTVDGDGTDLISPGIDTGFLV